MDATITRRDRALVRRPLWLARFEHRLGRAIPIHPHALSLGKLLVTPLVLVALARGSASPALVTGLLLSFAALDYLDGLVAREQERASKLGRVLDRITDYPLLIGVSYFCIHAISPALIAAKLGLDVLLLVLYALGRGSTQNRLRTVLSYATLLGLLALSQGWLPGLVTAALVRDAVWLGIAFSSLVALYNLDVLDKRYVADLLSFGNLMCGVVAMLCAAHGRFEHSLLLLLLGLGFDGFDGVAARRWGSTRWGVYSDDLADAVDFALAPAAAVFFALGGATGILLAIVFATCTIGRLAYFTLNKDSADPRYFSGVPSPVGALMVLCGVILFRDHPAVVGLLVGVACALMISFATLYRHLGRTLAARPRLLFVLPLLLAALAASWLTVGPALPVALLLAAALGYGLWPIARAFVRVVRARGASLGGDRPCASAPSLSPAPVLPPSA